MDFQSLFAAISMAEWILLGLLTAAVIIQIYFHLGIYLPLYREKDENPEGTGDPLSVIICARNEAENIKRFLPEVLEQDYPEFEVIVINDGSTDNTEEVLGELAGTYPRLSFRSLPPNDLLSRGKKLALTVGLKAASYEKIILTDADCYPRSKNWLRAMSHKLESPVEVVLGYGAYEKRKGVLNVLIRYETLITALLYLGLARRGHPYMGVGRNLAYVKSLFFKGSGFAGHYHIPSGDDDLFVNQHARKDNTGIEIAPGSHTISLPETSFRAWFRQKRRHLGAGKLYRRSSRLVLGIETLSRMLPFYLLPVLAVLGPGILLSCAIFLIYISLRLVVLKLGMKRLNEKYLLLPSLIIDPVLPVILGTIWLGGSRRTKNKPWS